MAGEAEVMEGQQDEADAPESDADFESGFDGAPTETPPPADSTPEDAEAKGDKQDAPPPEPEPEYVQITKQELESLKALSTRIDQIHAEAKKGIDTAHGRYGELARRLNESASNGMTLEVDDDVVAEFNEEFPELGGKLKGALQKLATKLKPAASFDKSQVEPLISAATVQAKRELAGEVLSLKFEDWEEIVGLPDAQGQVPDTAYRQWLAKQPEEYRQKIGASWSGRELAKSIAKFQSDAKAATEAAVKAAKPAAPNAPPQANAPTRKERLAAAVTARGEGGAPPSASADDEFESGFKTG